MPLVLITVARMRCGTRSRRGLIAAGLQTFEISATMGTSLEQLSKTYAHLLPDSADRAKVALNLYINNAAQAAERRTQ